MLLFLLWQSIPDDPGASKLWLAFYMTLGGIAGACLKSLIDFLTGWRKTTSDVNKTKSDIHKTEADIDLIESNIQKNDNEAFGQVQDKLFAANRLLMEMQEKLGEWIGRFERAAEDSSKADDELRLIRRQCHECMETRTGYYDLCVKIDSFFNRFESILLQDQDAVLELKNLRFELLKLNADHETDIKPK